MPEIILKMSSFIDVLATCQCKINHIVDFVSLFLSLQLDYAIDFTSDRVYWESPAEIF